MQCKRVKNLRDAAQPTALERRPFIYDKKWFFSRCSALYREIFLFLSQKVAQEGYNM